MKSVIWAAALCATGLWLTGCATVTRGTTTQLQVASTPPGASVKTSTGFTCAPTPCKLKVPRKSGFGVTVAKAGYAPQTVQVHTAVHGGGAAGFVGNAVLGGLVGMAVDGSDGAMNDLVPNPVSVTLVKAVEASAAAPDTTPPAARTPSSSATPAAPPPAQP